MTIKLKQSTASQEVPLGYFLDEDDGKTAETGLTIANTDIKLWKMGATTLANKNSGGATHISAGLYYCVLDATDTNTLGAMIIFVHVSGALPVRVECEVLAANVYDSLIPATDKLQVNVQRWGEEMFVLESVSDEWKNNKCVRKTEVHGAVRVFTLDVYETDVEWMDSVVQRLQARATLGTTVWLSSDKTIRQILREVVILEVVFAGEPGEPGEYREYTVKMREAF